jgi:hypothetical protein
MMHNKDRDSAGGRAMLMVFMGVVMAASIGLLHFVPRLGVTKADEYRLPFGGM